MAYNSTFKFDNGNESPCKACENKGCGAYHSECEKYRKYKSSITEYKLEMNKNKKLDRAFDGVSIAKSKRLKKYRKGE